MSGLSFVAIIPARYASSRFPGKPLADLGGHPVIEHVYRRVSEVLDEVYVATDDTRIADVVTGFGGRAIMTSPDHPSGTDRVNEAYTISGSKADVIINVQGDEPFIAASQLRLLMKAFDDPETDIATLAKRFDARSPYENLADANLVKVVCDKNNMALYFSRSVIPYTRGYETSQWPGLTQYLTHVGIYAYRADILSELTQLVRSPLEIAESLEQLRWLQNGYRIKVGLIDVPTIGIDTPADLENARKYLQSL